MRILFIVAHVDDAELAAGGMIAKMACNHDIKVYSLSHEYDGINLTEEFMDSITSFRIQGSLGEVYAELGDFRCRMFINNQALVGQMIREQIISWQPDMVVTHDSNDRHSDHSVTGQQVKRMFNGQIITFMSPWNGNDNPNYFVEMEEHHLNDKLYALSFYKSQAHRPYMSPDAIMAQAVTYGLKCGKKYAEGFQVHRLIY